MNETIMNVFFIITGVMALVSSLITFLLKKKEHILLGKASIDVCWTLNFLFKGNVGHAGVIQNLIAVIRDLFSYFSEKKIKFFSYKFWKYIFIVSFVIIPIFSWSTIGWVSLLPMLGSMLSTFSLYAKDAKTTRILTIPAQSLCLAYTIIISNIFGILGYSFQIISAVVGLIYYRDKK